MNSIPWSPVLRYATPLPMIRTPVSTIPLQHKSVSSVFVVRHTPPDQQDPASTVGSPTQVRFLCFVVRQTHPMNRIPFRMWSVEHKAVSSVVRYDRPRFHRLFRPSRLAPDEQDDAFRSDPAGCLPMNTNTVQLLRCVPAMYSSTGRTYARVGVRDPARM